MDEFFTPPNHVHFLAKKLFGEIEGTVIDGSIAYIDPNGGGPLEPHTHPHDHLFIVIEGEITISTPEEEICIQKNNHFLLKGMITHAVFNKKNSQAIVMGISIML